MGRGVLLAALLGGLLPLGGCERAMSARPPAFQLTDITGAPFGRDFSLTDHTGQRRSLADYRGKVVALMFGYLHCPDMCPTTLLELKQVLQGLGPAASGVQVLFVTLDPERDTAASLASGVARFDPAFVGLRGSPAETSQLARQFNVAYQQHQAADGSRSIDHSAGSYIFDRQGRLRLYAAYGSDNRVLEHDLRLLLSEK